MKTIGELAHYVRSKNAGPFWVTMDIFFDDNASYELVSRSEAITEESLAPVLDTDPQNIRIFRLPAIRVIKISVPRKVPQGGPDEYDMHGGQQYIPLCDIPIKTD